MRRCFASFDVALIRLPQLLLDEREKEGAALRKWFDSLENKDPQKVEPRSIVEFIEQFVFAFRQE